MNNQNEERNIIVDSYTIKQELIKLTMTKHNGKEPTIQELNKFTKYLIMEYENNTSKNSLENRINSICKAIETKYDKYQRITKL